LTVSLLRRADSGKHVPFSLRLILHLSYTDPEA
jgi:hypothetical protein